MDACIVDEYVKPAGLGQNAFKGLRDGFVVLLRAGKRNSVVFGRLQQQLWHGRGR